MLAALIGAYHEDEIGLTALRPLVGATLVEHQARRAARAGAERILLLAPQMPDGLRGAVSRLRHDGLAVDIVPDLAVAAERLPDEALVLIMADGCLPDATLLAAGPPGPALLTLTDGAAIETYERIEGAVRWAGVARLRTTDLREAAGHVAEGWDALSTLLRRAVQLQVPRVDIGGHGLTEPPMILSDAAGADAERSLMAAAAPPDGEGWTDRLFDGVATWIMPHVASRAIAAEWLSIGAAGLALAAPLVVLGGWPSVALGVLMLGGPLTALAGRLSAVRAQALPHAMLTRLARWTGALLALGALALLLSRAGQWGWALVAALTPAGMALLDGERRLARRLDADRDDPALATGDALIWVAAPAALLGWGAALAAAAAYAVGSFVRVRVRTLRG